MYNWPSQNFSQHYGLVSHTTQVMYLNFIREREIQCNIESEWQIFEQLFHFRFICSQRFWQKLAERKSPKKYFFNIPLWFHITRNWYDESLPSESVLQHPTRLTSVLFSTQKHSLDLKTTCFYNIIYFTSQLSTTSISVIPKLFHSI